ncbi:MAG: hypothetical protein ACM31P_19210 [Actinomycetota bacterium]
MFPDFFARVPTITLRDPLARFLGAAEDGLIEYGFADAVKLAGHSCPTVAGAYLMTCRALKALYGDELPERGGIRVDFREDQGSGVAGVIASVVTLLTGAAGPGGFKGLAGRHGRRDLLHFGVGEVAGEVRFTRRDNGRSVTAAIDLSSIPADPRMPMLLQGLLSGDNNPESERLFGQLWQARVRSILIDHFDDPEVVGLTSP